VNGRKAKAIRRQALKLLYVWVKGLVPEEEAKKMKPEDAYKLLPKDTHVYFNRKLMLSSHSFKWFIKKIKNFNKVNNKNINEITLEDINA